MLSEFISEVKTRGMANPNKFKVDIAVPNVIPAAIRQNLKFIQLFCDQAQLPDINISTAQIRTYGEVREVPYENLYGNVNFSFYCDSDYIVKDFFDWWIKSISDEVTRHFNYYRDYTAPIINVITMNNDGREVYKATLFECYPKQMQAVSLDYASKDIVKVNVSMNYKYWRSERISNSTETSVNQDNNRFNNQDFSNLEGSLDSPINTSFAIPVSYLNDFNGFQRNINGQAQDAIGGLKDRIFGDPQSIYTENGDTDTAPFIVIADDNGDGGVDEF
jgi:hypothetical protein